jgi:hypothetical protein
MTDRELMQQALEALDGLYEPGELERVNKAITALRTAIEQAEQEPVAWQGVYDKTDLYYRKPPQADVRPLYTTPPAAQRQPLTDEEIAREFYKFEAASAWYQFARAIEAKLKEKNHA